MAHPTLANQFVANRERAKWHDKRCGSFEKSCDRMATAVPEWELLRETASAIKAHTQSRLAEYLEQFEANAKKHGVIVHWANDAAEHNRIVLDILQRHKVQRLVKSKSMLTEECHLNCSSKNTALKSPIQTWVNELCSFGMNAPAISSCQRFTSKKKKSENVFTNIWGLNRVHPIRRI